MQTWTDVRRELRQTGVVGLLLWSLLHAWLGHDLAHLHHGHHHVGQQHQSVGEATHTTAVHRPANDQLALTAPVALLVTFFHFALPQPQEVKEAPEFEVALYIEPQFLERPQSPRAPPLRFSFV